MRPGLGESEDGQSRDRATAAGPLLRRADPGPQLARTLSAAGKRVLLWDRPNCGASDIWFDGPSESGLHAAVLTGLIRELGLGPVAMLGGSAGSRVSLLAATRDPTMVSKLVIWWISGGPISLAQLAAYYCGDSAMAAALDFLGGPN